MNIVRLLQYLVAAPILIFGMVVNVYLALHFICRDCFVLVAQASHVAHFITLGSILMLVLGGQIMPRRWLVLVLLPGAVMFMVWYGSGFLPQFEPDVQGVEITVATYNVLGDSTNPDTTFAIADALDADVIAFQEMRPGLLSKLENGFREEYPYQVSLETRLVIISRYPIVESEAAPGKRFIRAVLDVEGQRVVVYDFHAAVPVFDVRRTYNDDGLSASVQEMLEQVRQELDPVIVLCDCNSTPRSVQYSWMDDALDEAHRARGRGFGLTFPANGNFTSFPPIRIDYVWYSDDFVVMDVKVWDESGGSDHFPLWSRLVLRDS